ncbi:hypothetical protein AGLY_013893 [Aphis glycines]|uniref:Transposable element P transposase n=1 Tax=Aphis glycines TaxID=307491 RepID=A0A6G0T6P2_APHGL|nr:hypothetical protein AGLY_013893 [Aphis glycines]
MNILKNVYFLFHVSEIRRFDFLYIDDKNRRLVLTLHFGQKSNGTKTKEIGRFVGKIFANPSLLVTNSLIRPLIRVLTYKCHDEFVHVSTFGNYAISIKMDYLEIIFHQITSIGELMSLTDKLTVLSFDETYISSKICFDKQNEQVLGSYKCVQTVVARGLVSNWKQPIYYSFDTAMTKDLLLNIIKELYSIGYETISIVNDMGPKNMCLWRDLNIAIENTSFEHPCSKQLIHIFADVPHLVKLTRNHFLDKGLILSNGTFVGKNIFQELINLDSKHDYRLAHKISERHILVNGPRRMNVRLAVQLLSNSVSKAIAYYGENKYIDKYNWKNVAEMISLFNKWFDLFNTNSKFDHGVESYGLNLNSQNGILDEMSSFIENMRVYNMKSGGKQKNMLPFQKGILIYNSSLKKLFLD